MLAFGSHHHECNTHIRWVCTNVVKTCCWRSSGQIQCARKIFLCRVNWEHGGAHPGVSLQRAHSTWSRRMQPCTRRLPSDVYGPRINARRENFWRHLISKQRGARPWYGSIKYSRSICSGLAGGVPLMGARPDSKRGQKYFGSLHFEALRCMDWALAASRASSTPLGFAAEQ